MKTACKITLIFTAFFFCPKIEAQNNILNDPAITAQEARTVYEKWGDWYPKPKYLLGVQTNVAYMTVWGMLAPSRNTKYKKGDDIRPLKPTGLETKRLLEAEEQKRQTEAIALHVDSIYNIEKQKLAYWTSLTVDVDPLWQLYFKKMLQPLKDFPKQPQGYQQWGLETNAQYQALLSNGAINNLQERLDILKDKLNQSRTSPMPRGKRFILYHDTLIGWRQFLALLKDYQIKAHQSDMYRRRNDMPVTYEFNKHYQTDKEIIQEVMNKYKNKY